MMRFGILSRLAGSGLALLLGATGPLLAVVHGESHHSSHHARQFDAGHTSHQAASLDATHDAVHEEPSVAGVHVAPTHDDEHQHDQVGVAILTRVAVLADNAFLSSGSLAVPAVAATHTIVVRPHVRRIDATHGPPDPTEDRSRAPPIA